LKCSNARRMGASTMPKNGSTRRSSCTGIRCSGV
jgi:hypothetical protein